MEQKKSQGSSRAMVAGSAAFFGVVLIGAAFFFRDEGLDTTGQQAGPAASETSGFAAAGAASASLLKPLLERCEEGGTGDAGGGRTRTRCIAKSHPAFMMELIGAGEQVERASMLVPMTGTMSEVLDRTQLGLDLFSLVAGAQADDFLPGDYLGAMGTSETSFVFEGRVYITQPMANAGLLFVVMPEPADSAAEI